jgi:CNT family concentrative nucleoside transporter
VTDATDMTGTFQLAGIARGLLGLSVLLVICWLLSSNKKAISLRLVITGLGMQILLGAGLIWVPLVGDFFNLFGKVFVKVLDFSKAGSEYLFGPLVSGEGYIFALQVLPTLIFFSALISVLYHYHIIQHLVKGMSWLLQRSFRLSGSESLCTAANIFLGQLESAMLVRGYLPRMTSSEIFLIMTSGMANIAGGVMAAYIGFLGGDDPEQRLMFARHLLAASVMSAPAAIMVAKMMVPQTAEVDREAELSLPRRSTVMEALTDGVASGTRTAVMVGAVLLVFVAFIALFNELFHGVGRMGTLNEWVVDFTGGRFDGLSLEFLLGVVFSPVAWVCGVCPQDMLLVGQLLGKKLIMTEFIAYTDLASLKEAGAFYSSRSIIMATYMLCGFANFCSLGMLIGWFSSEFPGHVATAARLGVRSVAAGMIASLFCATIIGMMMPA